ncbi:uncharacterized protein LOC126801028 [Argentina anserina]|uniref:uncharacterized protein LOC126801028 n=1 Tax=Argentina anserina TaxID=57926 RepID=UPI002176276A|nr:uncharacterized protein LOC126801028 [Potentilla anserina]
MTEPSSDLPRECWEHIFNLLDHSSHLAPLSLVSKQFLHITNRLLHTLKLSTPPPLSILPRLLHRFQSLKQLDLTAFKGDTNPLLHRISLSGLNLVSLNISNQTSLPVNGLRMFSSRMVNLKSLDCSKVRFLHDSDLTLIAESFPLLQELDISYPEFGPATVTSGWKQPISDSGIYSLTVNLKSLRRINLSGNHFITDVSLVHLAKHCVLLTQVVIHGCDFITHNGVARLIRACGSLNSVLACGIGVSSLSLGLGLLECARKSSEALCVIDFSDSVVSDELLCSVAEACFPMKKLVLSNCTGYTFAGLCFLVRHYPLLEYLDLEGADFLTDNEIFELSMSLGSITYINLSYCSRISGAALYTLARNCRVLNGITMVGTNVGDEELETDIVPNLGIKSLNFCKNISMGDRFIANYVCFCPNLEMLDLSYCINITEDGIVDILKRCSRIRHLDISTCGLMENLSLDFEVPQLEVLCAGGLRINDYGLAIIGNRCSRLHKLDLSGCLFVTANGVKEVVDGCKELRDINLSSCYKVGLYIIPWMVFSRPSLKRIIQPSGASVPTGSQRNHFLRHGYSL